MYYIGVGPTRVDPLPEVFGPRRSPRIRRVEELPRVLAHVHRELVAVDRMNRMSATSPTATKFSCSSRRIDSACP